MNLLLSPKKSTFQKELQQRYNSGQYEYRMAEQISHKKSLRVNRLNRDRRQLLKEYYKLDATEHGNTNENKNENKNETISELQEIDQKDNKSTLDSSVKEVERSISEQTFKELVQTHNSLLKRETETNNSIKNTIYENYYDLIKVDDLLKGITEANESQLSKLRETVEMLRK